MNVTEHEFLYVDLLSELFIVSGQFVLEGLIGSFGGVQLDDILGEFILHDLQLLLQVTDVHSWCPSPVNT